MRTFLIGFLCVVLMSPQSNANLIEDIIDLYGAYGSWGMSLRVREMSEAEMTAELDRRLAAKLLEITNEAKRKRAEIIKKQIAGNLESKFQKEQILETINKSLQFSQELDQGYKDYVLNRIQISAELDALVLSLDLQSENILAWTQIFKEVSNGLISKGENQDLKIPLVAMNFESLAKKLGLAKEELMKISIHLSDPEEMKGLISDLSFILLNFEVMQTQLETQIQIFDMKIESLEKALTELKN